MPPGMPEPASARTRNLPCTLALALVLSMSAGAPSLAGAEEALPDGALETLDAVVGLRALVPGTARTAASLGTERAGSGVVIDGDGLVLTIGYLILEAARVTLVTSTSREVPAEILAYDHGTGFGLVRALGELDVKPMRLGSSASVEPTDRVLVVSHGGPAAARPAVVVSRREFAGYWEYLLEDALFTAPPHPMYGGAALIGPQGRLLGIGSLMVGDAGRGEQNIPGNMFVPIDALVPVMGAMLSGASAGHRPWLGLFTQEALGRVIVTRVAAGGPASAAGIERGDLIVGVGGEPVSNMAGFYRRVWASGKPGARVTLDVLQGAAIKQIDVISANRYDWLRLNPSH